MLDMSVTTVELYEEQPPGTDNGFLSPLLGCRHKVGQRNDLTLRINCIVCMNNTITRSL